MKAKAEIKEFRGLDRAALVERIATLEEELLNLRFQRAAGQLQNSARVRQIRRSIARAKTAISAQPTVQ